MSPGIAEVQVYDPATAVTIGPRRMMPISVPLMVQNLIYDAKRERLYARLLGSDDGPATELAAVDPASGAIERRITVGKTPNRMRSRMTHIICMCVWMARRRSGV